MIGLILDTLIVIGLISIFAAIAWVDIEMRLEKRKKAKEEMYKKNLENVDKFRR